MATIQFSKLADTLVKAGAVKDREAFVALCRSDWQAAQNVLLGALARVSRPADAAATPKSTGPVYPPVMAGGNYKPEGVRVSQAGDPWHVKIGGEAAHPQALRFATQHASHAVTASAARLGTGYYDRSASIAASGDNARRLAAARAAEERRIRCEQAARGM